MQPRPWNPLASQPAVACRSSYLGYGADGLTRLLEPARAPIEDETRAHAALLDRILDRQFPCVAARSALNRQTYRLGVYPQLGSAESASAVCHDLYEFCHEFERLDDRFVTFIAAFQGPSIQTEAEFEQSLWNHLQRMHEVDAAHFGWSPAVSSDPDSPHFSFSIGARAFFIVGLNPQASRHARTAPLCMVAFNFHEQFERLRQRDKYDLLKQAIRRRDLDYQGSLNPMLSDFGNRSESRQYSGRAVPADWKCPFHAVGRSAAQASDA